MLEKMSVTKHAKHMLQKMSVTNISVSLTTFFGVVSVTQLVSMSDNAVLSGVVEIFSSNLTWGEYCSVIYQHN